MGARNASGVVAGGCGAFSLLGLLIGVGLTVWLGSMALDGIGGGGSSSRDRAPDVSTVPGTGDTAVTLTPDGPLAAGTPIRVAGTGYIATSKVQVLACLRPVGDGPPTRCDPTGAVEAKVDALGEIDTTYIAPAAVTVDGRAQDCTTRNARCLLVARSRTGPTTRYATAALVLRST